MQFYSSQPIEYQKSSDLWPAVGHQERLWNLKTFIFLIGCLITLTPCTVLLQKSCGNKIPVPQSLSWWPTVAKKPEDSGHEIASQHAPLRVVTMHIILIQPVKSGQRSTLWMCYWNSHLFVYFTLSCIHLFIGSFVISELIDPEI